MKMFQIFTLFLICLVPPVLIGIEFSFFDTMLSEYGLVEIAQELIVCFIVVQFLRVHKKSNSKISLVLALFFIVVLLRELDFLFDLIIHGFWFYPCALIGLMMARIFYKEIESIKKELDAGLAHIHAPIFILGLAILLVLSRIFGTGTFWEMILAEHYQRIVKTVVQEGLELFGYSVLLLSLISLRRKESKPQLHS